MRIHPAILTDSIEEYERQLQLDSEFVVDIDIDVIDWSRTEDRTVSIEEALSVPTEIELHFDLMMDHPGRALDHLLAHPKVKTVTFNLESKDDVFDLIKEVQSAEKFVGISANPDNSLDEIKDYLNLIEFVQIMTISPGKQGSSFLPEQLEVVSKIDETEFNGLIGIDGGVNLETITRVLDYPVHLISVGSAIAGAKDPKAAFDKLSAVIRAKEESEKGIGYG